VAPPIAAVLVVGALVLAVAYGGWGLIWLLVPAMIIARRSACQSGAAQRYGHRN
jgi:hypothetical protein